MRTRLSMLAFVVAASACDGLQGPATGVDYRGEPLAVVNGRMTAERNITLLGDLRLAVAWFTTTSVSGGRPDALVTESVVYEPVFPAQVSVGLYDLPEVPGTSDIAGSAVGVLMAYDDRNRNGTLDTFRGGAAPTDVVLGTSLGSLTAGNLNGYFIVFVREPGQPGMPPSVQRGLNLLRAGSEVVGFDAVVPIHLDALPGYNAFICEDLISVDGGSLCFDSIYPRLDAGEVDAGANLRVSGSVGFSTGLPALDLTVYAGSSATADAAVTMNGIAVPYDATAARYRDTDVAGSVVPGADNTLRVVANGYAPLTMTVYVAGDFDVTAPTFNAAVDAGQPFGVSWTESKDAGSYRVTVYRNTPFASIHDQQNIASLNHTVPPLGYVGNATLNVQASLPDINDDGSFIYRYTSRSIPIRFQ